MTYDKFGINDPKPGNECKFYHKDYPVKRPFNKSAYLKTWDEYLDEPVKVVLDIGSLDGGDTLRFNSWYPDAKIYSIEGSPHNFKVISQKLEERKNVQVFNCVISNKTKEVEFHQVSYDASRDQYKGAKIMMMGSIYKMTEENRKMHQLSPAGSVTVQAFTVDRFCKDNNITSVDIMHTDVEGAGIELLEGMHDIRPKMIYLEKERDDLFDGKSSSCTDKLRTMLEARGYTMKVDLLNDYLFVRND